MENEYSDRFSAMLAELVTPDMANHYGNLFGGVLLSLADKAAYVCAARYSRQPCVTASMDQMSFLGPVHIGELLLVCATLIYVGRSSMSVEIEIHAEHPEKGKRHLVSRCMATMVAIKNGQPVQVPSMECHNIEEKRSCLRGRLHRELAREHAKRIHSMETRVDSLSADEIEAELRG